MEGVLALTLILSPRGGNDCWTSLVRGWSSADPVVGWHLRKERKSLRRSADAPLRRLLDCRAGGRSSRVNVSWFIWVRGGVGRRGLFKSGVAEDLATAVHDVVGIRGRWGNFRLCWGANVSIPKRQGVFPDWQCALQGLTEIWSGLGRISAGCGGAIDLPKNRAESFAAVCPACAGKLRPGERGAATKKIKLSKVPGPKSQVQGPRSGEAEGCAGLEAGVSLWSMGRAFSPLFFGDGLPGALPAGWYEVAPLALGDTAWGARGLHGNLKEEMSENRQIVSCQERFLAEK